MKANRLLHSFVLLMATLLSACASGPTIISNQDPTFDFFGVQTFAFMRPLSTDQGNTQTLLSSHLIAATTREMEIRGMRQVDSNPDVFINFVLETQEQIRSRNTSASVGMHRTGRYGMWGGSMSTPTIEQTTQGQLSIDMIDPQRNQLVWEGSATNRVTDSIRRNQEQAANEFVTAIFDQFPR